MIEVVDAVLFAAPDIGAGWFANKGSDGTEPGLGMGTGVTLWPVTERPGASAPASDDLPGFGTGIKTSQNPENQRVWKHVRVYEMKNT